MEKVIQDNEPIREEPKEKNNGMPNENSFEEKYDHKYRQKILGFFNNEIIKGLRDDPEMSLLNDEVEAALKKLGKNENLKNLKLEDYSFALSYLIGQMDHDLYKGDIDLEINKKHEVRTQQSKELFMESCKKIYSNVDEARPTDIRMLSRNLSKLRGTLFSDDKFDAIDVVEIRKAGKAEPDIHKLKDIATKLQEMLKDITLQNNYFVYKFELEIDEETSKDGMAFVEEYKKKKALINEYIYEVMLTRDTVYEKLYGNKDISVEEAKKIDETREKIENK